MASAALLEELVPQVKRNCDISDAHFWGYHSTCGLLLRLRELYRSERGLRPWHRIETAEIARWIGEREALWKELEDADFSPLAVGGRRFAAFDAPGLNEALRPEGLLYGAGYGAFGKPVFFVARLEGRETLEGREVLLAGKEFARDISLHPAMLQDGVIFARKEVAELLVWEKFEEYAAGRSRGLLGAAFGFYGIGRSASGAEAEEKVRQVADDEVRAYIYHEVGEAVEGERLGPGWAGMLGEVLSSRASAYLRAVKDVLADTSDKGMLRHIIRNRNSGALAFYMAFLSGMRRTLSEGVVEAHGRFMADGLWEAVERARAECYERTLKSAGELMEAFGRGGPEALLDDIGERMKGPRGSAPP
ncbi:MAG: hypothetical protein Kow0025_00290 [Thermodesulfovibrionales bacterium]